MNSAERAGGYRFVRFVTAAGLTLALAGCTLPATEPKHVLHGEIDIVNFNSDVTSQDTTLIAQSVDAILTQASGDEVQFTVKALQASGQARKTVD